MNNKIRKSITRYVAAFLAIAILAASSILPLIPEKAKAYKVEDFLGGGPYTYSIKKSTVDTEDCPIDQDCLVIKGEAGVEAEYSGPGGEGIVTFGGTSGIVWVSKTELGKGYADKMGENQFDITLGIETARNFFGLPPPEVPDEEDDPASALPNEGEWKDLTTIKYNGTYFRDSNIYEGPNEYEQVSGSCKSKMTIIDMWASGDRAEFSSFGGTGCTQVATKTITLNEAAKRVINGYRLDWDTGEKVIFMPQYLDCSTNGNGLNCSTNTMGFFKKIPPDHEYYDEADKDFYWQYGGAGYSFVGSCNETPHVYAKVSDDDASKIGHHQQKTHSRHCPGGISGVELLLANKEFQPPADVYGTVDVAAATVTGANGNPGGSSLGDNGGTIDDPTETEAPDITCEVQLFNPLTWIACPLIEAAQLAVTQFDNAITQRLTIPTGDYFDTGNEISNGFYTAWSTFRYLALVLLVIIGLIMIIAQASSSQFVDAYTIKKVMPKIFIAVIAISLSWSLMKFAIDISNALGSGVRAIIYAPFKGMANPNLGAGAGSLLTLGAGAALFSLGMLGMLSFAVTALLAVLIGFFIIVFREMLVMLLVVTAPVAIIAWILPNTQKVWKIWSDFFVKALLAFPIITMMIATGHVFSQIAATKVSGSSQGSGDDLLWTTIQFICYFGPYFMIPTAFRLAGGAIATISGMANDKTRGAFDRLRNFRKGQRDKNWEATKGGNRFKGNNIVSRKASSALQTATLAGEAGLNPKAMRGRIQSAKTNRNIEMMSKAKEHAAVQTALSNDDLLDAYANSDGSDDGMKEHFKQLGMTADEAERNIGLVRQAERAAGAENFRRVAAVANAGTGTGYGKGSAHMLKAINLAAGGDSALKARMIAEARSNAERSKRGDLYGASFSENMKAADFMERNGNSVQSMDAVGDYMHDKALDSKSAAELLSGRAGAMDNLIPAMKRRLDGSQAGVRTAQNKLTEAKGSGNAASIKAAQQGLKAAQDNHTRNLALTTAFHDSLSHSSPEIAKKLADNVFGASAGITREDGTQVRYIDQINEERGGPTFDELRKDYATGTSGAGAAGAEAGAIDVPPPEAPA